jgi:serine/threonine-protein kinase
MSEPAPSHPQPLDRQDLRTDPAYELWCLWQQGQAPDVRDFLATHPDLPLTRCLGVLRVDQQQRWLLGQRVQAEEYLESCFFLHESAEHALDLVYGEFLLRLRLGESPSLDEYARRFPQFAEQLRLQLELHRALGDEGARTSAVDGLADLAERPTVAQPQVGPDGSPLPRVPGYEILGMLGRGGMGVVYRARQRQLRRLVALKMLRGAAAADGELLARFRAEWAALARLQHPNIVQVYEVGEHEGRPFFALEYVPGGSLDRQIARTPQPPGPAAQYVQTLARAVHSAHERGIVHRDLKPANVLVAEDGTPKVADFGLAKLLAAEAGQSSLDYQTHSGAILGTPSYMAPEQTGGRAGEVGPAADVYALGAILYELLTGRPPFQGASLLETLEQVRSQEPVPPSRLQPKVPRDLETICLKCLAKAPGERYPSAEALADDLGRFLLGQPIKARPTSLRERCWKWARRRPAVASLALALGAALVGLLGLWAWSYVEIRAALHQARADRQAAVLAALKAAQEQREAERQRERATRNEKEALSKAEYARRGLGFARLAVDRFFTYVAQERLLHVREMEGLRKELLRNAALFYEQLEKEGSDDLERQAERARAYMRHGLIVAKTEGAARARPLYERGLKLFEKLVAGPDADNDLRVELSLAHTALGDLDVDLRRFDPAEAAYRKALAIQEKLTGPPRRAAEYRAHAASTRHNLGLLYHMSGRLRQAEEEFRQAVRIREELVRAYPKTESYRRGLAMTQTELANLLISARQLSRAAEPCRAAVAANEELHKAHPTVVDYRVDLARSLVSLGNLHVTQGRPVQGADAFKRARDLLKPLADAHPTVSYYQNALAVSYRGLGMVHADRGERKEAEEFFRQAAEVFTRLHRSDSKSPEYAINLTACWHEVGVSRYQDGKYADALPLHEQGVAVLGPLVKRDARNLAARELLWRHLQGRAQSLTRLKRHAEALRDWEEALRLNKGPHRPLLLVLRAITQARSGDHEAAAMQFDKIADFAGHGPHLIYEAALGYAACAQAAADDARLDGPDRQRLANRHAGHAVALLERVRRAGLFALPSARQHLASHADLDVLRARGDFRELLGRVNGKAGTGG